MTADATSSSSDMLTRCPWIAGDPLLADYHDRYYGVRPSTDAELFEMLALELNQAGLSWRLIWNRRQGFRRAFRDFDVDQVAEYTEADVERLLADPGIIRNRRKIQAVIHNARAIQQLQREHGSFAAWLEAQQDRGLDVAGWTKLFRHTFKFTGAEITGEFLMSCGYLPIQHHPDCFLVRDPAPRQASGRPS